MARAATLFAALLLANVSGAALAQAPASAAQPAAQSPHDRLFRLFQESDEDNLRRNPLGAMFRGDYRYAAQLGDGISDEYFAAERGAAEQELAALAAIDRDSLNETDRIAYDVFKYTRENDLANVQPDILALTAVRPLNHFSGFHTFYPVLASGRGAAPFRNVEDYENNLARHRQFVAMLPRVVARFREGMASGVVETRLTITNVIGQLDTQLAAAPEQSPYYGPVENFPEGVPETERARLRQAHLEIIRDGIYPALRQLRDFLENDYLPRAREGVGLSSMQGGDRLYRRLIADNTTLPLTPEEVHQIGLREVARIRGEMEAIRQRVGFSGTLPEFFEFLRTDPQFAAPSRDAMREGYYAIGRRVDQRIGEIFSTLPRSRLEIREVETFRERNASHGSYQGGTPDGSRPGIFYYNAYDLPSRRTHGMEALYLHEGAPGHHFQISLALENEALPSFMRFGGTTAFAEGWGLYAETLWDELGMESDPYARFGGLNAEMYRAMRLVVDTGIHAKGWTREQGIDYMLANSGLGRTQIVNEVERYIAIPAQALAYKIGALKILELRALAEERLGSRFDLREFHAQVLMTGSLPLPVLESKIHEWIARRLAG
jgi:uncharacterized protein (DUF885 family)